MEQSDSKDLKCYVEVISSMNPQGVVTPLEIIMDDGRRYLVDRVVERRYAPSMKCGGYGYRYTCMIGGKPHFLWQDDHAFYVQLEKGKRIQ
jgi:hypothetical protein